MYSTGLIVYNCYFLSNLFILFFKKSFIWFGMHPHYDVSYILELARSSMTSGRLLRVKKQLPPFLTWQGTAYSPWCPSLQSPLNIGIKKLPSTVSRPIFRALHISSINRNDRLTASMFLISSPMCAVLWMAFCLCDKTLAGPLLFLKTSDIW